jgi:hypothetical protein
MTGCVTSCEGLDWPGLTPPGRHRSVRGIRGFDMAIRITIDIFSGRPNPVVKLDGREARDALKQLRPIGNPTEPSPLRFQSRLGYRGLLIQISDQRAGALPTNFRLFNGRVFGRRFSGQAAVERFEDYICGNSGPIRRLQLGPRLEDLIRKDIEQSRSLGHRSARKRTQRPPKGRCQCAPLYEPVWWNDGGQRQFNNNCYNYSTNCRTDTFAQPGLAAGAIYTALTCAAVRPAAVRDDLIDAPTANNRCPKEGHLVALVVWPNGDFHWYRKGRNGYWTHKPGGTPATNLDNSGVIISDPRTADRGPYTDFCTFMVVMHGHIKIR